MDSIAVVYSSKYGHSKKYAEWLKEDIGAVTIDVGSFNMSRAAQYKLVIYIGGVYSDKMPIMDFIKKNASQMSTNKMMVAAVTWYVNNSLEAKSKLIEENVPDSMKGSLPFYVLNSGIDKKQITAVEKVQLKAAQLSIQKRDGRSNDDINALGIINGYSDYTSKDNLATLKKAIEDFFNPPKPKLNAAPAADTNGGKQRSMPSSAPRPVPKQTPPPKPAAQKPAPAGMEVPEVPTMPPPPVPKPQPPKPAGPRPTGPVVVDSLDDAIKALKSGKIFNEAEAAGEVPTQDATSLYEAPGSANDARIDFRNNFNEGSDYSSEAIISAGEAAASALDELERSERAAKAAQAAAAAPKPAPRPAAPAAPANEFEVPEVPAMPARPAARPAPRPAAPTASANEFEVPEVPAMPARPAARPAPRPAAPAAPANEFEVPEVPAMPAPRPAPRPAAPAASAPEAPAAAPRPLQRPEPAAARPAEPPRNSYMDLFSKKREESSAAAPAPAPKPAPAPAPKPAPAPAPAPAPEAHSSGGLDDFDFDILGNESSTAGKVSSRALNAVNDLAKAKAKAAAEGRTVAEVRSDKPQTYDTIANSLNSPVPAEEEAPAPQEYAPRAAARPTKIVMSDDLAKLTEEAERAARDGDFSGMMQGYEQQAPEQQSYSQQSYEQQSYEQQEYAQQPVQNDIDIDSAIYTDDYDISAGDYTFEDYSSAPSELYDEDGSVRVSKLQEEIEASIAENKRQRDKELQLLEREHQREHAGEEQAPKRGITQPEDPDVFFKRASKTNFVSGEMPEIRFNKNKRL